MNKHNFIFLIALASNLLAAISNKQRYTQSIIYSFKQGIFFCLTSLIYLPIIGQSGYISGSPELAYWEIGSKSELVIVLHGGSSVEHSYLRPEFDGLKKSARIIYYDQRGCGKSEAGSLCTWPEHVKDLKRVIEQHAGSKKVFLASSSWGSLFALLYAYTYPDDLKGLILSGLVYWRGKGKKITEAYYSDWIIRNPERYKPKVEKLSMKEHRLIKQKKADGKIIEELVEIEKTVNLYSGRCRDATMSSLVYAPILDSLKQIKTPTLIYNGSESCFSFETVNEYADVLPNSTLISIKGACHDPWFSNPELFCEIGNQFIKNTKKDLKKQRKQNKKLKP